MSRAPVDLNALPVTPGIYKMLDVQGVLLYVGKAKNIQKRVKSYFRPNDQLDVKTRHLVSNISAIETIVVRSETEALILEAQLIKQFQPRYNILLKDDKSFPFVKITNESFPRLFVVRERINDGALYFGPYPSIGSTKILRRLLTEMFRLRDCSQLISTTEVQPKCIKLDLNKCLGPCIYKDTFAEYRRGIENLKLILVGKNREIIRKLTGEMHLAASELKYEDAGRIRDQIRRIEQLGQKQSVSLDDHGTTQILAAAEEQGVLYIVIQTFVDGKLLFQSGSYFENPNRVDRCQVALQTIFKSLDAGKVKLIICDPWMEESVHSVVNAADLRVNVVVPKRGNKVVLLDNARQNARLAITRIIRDRSLVKTPMSRDSLLIDCKTVLKLNSIPSRIFGIDISHLQGTNIVGSAVCFVDGLPFKPGYRRLKIRSVQGESNDPLSIYETVSRRLQLCFTDHEPLPNLLLIDGGRGQINFAHKALVELGLENVIDIISLAKQNEEIYKVEKAEPIILSKDHGVLKLFQWVRDESHRFAITFQRQRRTALIESVILDSVPGLGAKRIKKLYKEFKSLDRLLLASDSEIAVAGGISLAMVAIIRNRIKIEMNL